MSSHLSTIPRQSLTPRQAEVVDRLLEAAGAELERVGHERLTVRAVAQRAQVSPATAYTYLASKDHLVAEVFWRRLALAPEPAEASAPDPAGPDPRIRLGATLAHLTQVVGASPAIAAAASKSLLGTDPHVVAIRLRIGHLVLDRFRTALGESADPKVLQALSYAFFGALLHCGMGLLPYAELPARMAEVLEVLVVEP